MCVRVCVHRCVRVRVYVYLKRFFFFGGGGCCCFFGGGGGGGGGGEGEGQHTNFMKRSSSGLCFTMLHTAKLHIASSSTVELL